MKATHLFIILAGLVLVGVSWLIWSTPAPQKLWADTTIQCLPDGHENLELHTHQQLAISVDGVPESIPGNIGISEDCMAEIHTHDATGEIHVETSDAGRTSIFTLVDFFSVWGKSFERDGYLAEIRVNGAVAAGPALVPLHDGDIIEIDYRSIDANAAWLDLKIGETASGLGVTIELLELVEDSRCPIDAVCIQMGTVRVRGLLSSGLGEGAQTFELNKTVTTEAEEVTLVDVEPEFTSSRERIEPSEYRFIFEIRKRDLSEINP